MDMYSMKLNYLTKGLMRVGHFVTTTILCVSAIAFVWQGAFFSNTAAMANPAVNLIASGDLGAQAKEKASEGFEKSRNFIDDTKESLKKTANKNADKVEGSTDDNGVVGKANRDAARIEERADEHAAKTKEAVDNTENFVERAIDNIKETFSK
jgi:methyl-accepting chemotaxis protein